MKIGISTNCYECETEDALSLIAEAGAKQAEIYLKTFYEYRPEFAKRYAENAKDTAICCVRTNAMNFEMQLYSPSRRIRGDGFYWLDQVCRSMQLFNAGYFVLHVPENIEIFSLSGYISGVIDFCRSYNLKVALENDGLKLPDLMKLRDGCGELYFGLTVKNLLDEKGKFYGYSGDKCGAIAFLRLRDKKDAEHKELYKYLQKLGFDGTVIVDYPDVEIKELII